MSSSSSRALGRSTIRAMILAFVTSSLQALLNATLRILPSLSSNRDSISTLNGFCEFALNADARLASLLFSEELSNVFADCAETVVSDLSLHPFLERRGKRDVHACSHRSQDNGCISLCQSVTHPEEKKGDASIFLTRHHGAVSLHA